MIDYNQDEGYRDDFDIRNSGSYLWSRRKALAVYSTLLIVLINVYILVTPNIYRSEAVLFPSTGDGFQSSGSALLSQFGGIAGLSGLTQRSEGASNRIKALAILESRAFIGNFIDAHELSVAIMATEPGFLGGKPSIDESLYDSENQAWVEPEPSEWEIIDVFLQIMSVSQNIETGLITVSLEWFDQSVAREWLTWLIDDLNAHVKRQDIDEAEKSIAFLQDQIERTQLVDMKNIFYSLIENETQTLMLTDVRDQYVFQIIDPPTASDEHVYPNRIMFFILSSVFSISAVVFLLLMSSRRESQLPASAGN